MIFTAVPLKGLVKRWLVLGRQLGDRLVTLDRLKLHLTLNSAENRLRVPMVIRPLHRRIHLSRLSHEGGPPLFLGPRQANNSSNA
jgi:hypothetical protein